MDPIGLNQAAKTVTAAIPAVTGALSQAEQSIQQDLAGVEKAIADSLTVAVSALADGISQILSAVDRIDGGKITIGPIEIRFDFPLKATK